MRFREQIMFKNKYTSIFLPQMEAIVFIILQIFFTPRVVLRNWGIFSDIPQYGMETSCLCPFEGHKHGGRKVT